MNVTSALESDLARFYRGRRVVLLGHPLSAYGRQSAALLRTGAHAPFVVAGGTGPGQPPMASPATTWSRSNRPTPNCGPRS